MSASLLDLAPRDFPARGAGSNTEAPLWTSTPPGYTAVGQAIARAGRDDYGDWLHHVQAAAGCTRPIRLTGTLSTVETGTGRVLDHRHTDQLPDAVIYKACGNRRATVCPSCARTYQRDAYQLLRAGLVGGKGVPATVARHPAVFLTLTAASFGTVHTRTVARHTCRNRRHCDCRPQPCHARRDTGLCPHGQPAVCWARHEPNDPVLGQPLCLDCYDHDHHVVFNLHAAELWHRTKQAAERALAKLCRERGISPVAVTSASGTVRFVSPVRLAHGKAAEMQRRGAIHFHALIRLDGVHPTDPDAVIPPPPGIGVDDLVDALDAAVRDIAFTTADHPARPGGWPITWGEQVDVQPLVLAGNGTITDDTVAEQLAAQKAGYLAKYATRAPTRPGTPPPASPQTPSATSPIPLAATSPGSSPPVGGSAPPPAGTGPTCGTLSHRSSPGVRGTR